MKAKLRLKNVIFCSIMYVYIKKGGFKMYSDYGANTLLATPKVTSSAVWIIISAVLAIVGGIVLYFTFLSKKNEGKFTGFLGWVYDF